jgi:hypothetical protein
MTNVKSAKDIFSDKRIMSYLELRAKELLRHPELSLAVVTFFIRNKLRTILHNEAQNTSNRNA